MSSIYWLIAFVILVGIEVATMALTTIWFAGGSPDSGYSGSETNCRYM